MIKDRILIVGYGADRTIIYFIKQLTDFKLKFDVLDVSDYVQRGIIWEEYEKNFEVIRIGNHIFPLNEYLGVYIRCYNIHHQKLLPIDMRKNVEYKLNHLNEIFRCLPIPVINKPRTGMSNSSKPYQTLLLNKCGFKLPQTYSTNSKSGILKEIKKHKLIFKSNSSIRSIVTLMESKYSKSLDTLKNCPVLFQEYIEGNDVRIHSVGRNYLVFK